MEDSVDSRKESRVDHRDAQWIPAFAGMTGEASVGGNPWLLCSFSMITLRHSRVGGNPLNTTQAS